MKKVIYFILVFSVLTILASCASIAPTPPKNAIMSSELTAGQQEIIDLLSVPNNCALMIFDFNTYEAYRSIEIWVEVCQDGEIINRIAGLGQHSDVAEKRNGRLAVIINQNDTTYHWTLSLVENGGRASSIGTTEMTDNSMLARAYGPMDDSASIEDGKEIILYKSIFSTGSINAYDCQTLQEQADLLKEYPYAYLIKCKFTK